MNEPASPSAVASPVLGYGQARVPAMARGASVMALALVGVEAAALCGMVMAWPLDRRMWEWVAVCAGATAIGCVLVAWWRGGWRRRGGWLLAGVLAGLAGAGLWALPAVPSIKRTGEPANPLRCASNLRAIGTALVLYSNANRNRYPPDLRPLLTAGLITADQLVCPSSADTTVPGTTAAQQAANLPAGPHVSYVYLGKGMNNGVDAETIVMYERLPYHGPFRGRGEDGFFMLFGDGHVEKVPVQQARRMIEEIKAGHNPPRKEKVE